MTTPVRQSIPIGAFVPLLKRTMSVQTSNMLLHDYYTDYFKRMGIKRDEMLIVTNAYLTTDPLVGTAILRYIDEDTKLKDDTQLKPLN